MHADALEDTLLDTRYRVETPEGIALALAPAGVVARGYAFAIDLGVRLALFSFSGTRRTTWRCSMSTAIGRSTCANDRPKQPRPGRGVREGLSCMTGNCHVQF